MNNNTKTYEEFEKRAIELIRDGFNKITPADEPNLENQVPPKLGYLFLKETTGIMLLFLCL